MIIITGFTVVSIFYLNKIFKNTKTHTIIQLDSTIFVPILPRILCLILTSPKNFVGNARAVNETWAIRCDGYFFVSEPVNRDNATDNLPIITTRSSSIDSTAKINQAFRFVSKHYLNNFDWFIVVDYETYLLVENLKDFLNQLYPTEPLAFTSDPNKNHLSYILSQQALKIFNQAQQNPKSDCRKNASNRNVPITECLQSENVSLKPLLIDCLFPLVNDFNSHWFPISAPHSVRCSFAKILINSLKCGFYRYRRPVIIISFHSTVFNQ